MGLITRHCWLIGLMLAGAGGGTPFAGEGTGMPPSILEIPVQMPLAALFRETEQAVPWQAGNWQDWKSSHGVQTRYRAWRGPLALRMMGNELLVQAHIRYWIKARVKRLHVFALKSDCGVKEPPRQAVVGVLVRLQWTPDWSLDPHFRILPTRFLDRCEMTAAQIDVTGIVDRLFYQRLQDSLRDALRAVAPRLSGIRRQAERAWLRLQEPVALGDDTWLSLRPAGVALSPLAGRGDNADARIVLVLYPKLTMGPEPPAARRPLPLLWQYYPRSPGLRVQIALDLDLSTLGRQIAASLEDRPFELNGRQFGVETLLLSAGGQTIQARIQLSGEAAGTAVIRGAVYFSPRTQELRLHELEYAYEPEDSAVALLSELFYERIRQRLEEAANRLLTSRLEKWKQRLSSGIRETLPEEIRFDPLSLRLDSARIQILENTLRLHALASE